MTKPSDPATIGYWCHLIPIGTIVRHYHTGEIAEVFGYCKRNGVILIDVIEPGTHAGKWSADASWLPICTKHADGEGEPSAFDLLFAPEDNEDPGYTDWLEKQNEYAGDVTTYDPDADYGAGHEDEPDYFAKDGGTGWSLADEENYHAEEFRIAEANRSAEDKARDAYGLTDGEQEYLDSRGER